MPYSDKQTGKYIHLFLPIISGMGILRQKLWNSENNECQFFSVVSKSFACSIYRQNSSIMYMEKKQEQLTFLLAILEFLL